MAACAVATAAVIFALLPHVLKTPRTQRLQVIEVVIAFVVIVATVFEKLGWIR
jgi:hypothetical protein